MTGDAYRISKILGRTGAAATYIYHILQYTEENCELHSIIVKHQTYEKVVIATRWRIQDFSDGRGDQPQR